MVQRDVMGQLNISRGIGKERQNLSVFLAYVLFVCVSMCAFMWLLREGKREIEIRFIKKMLLHHNLLFNTPLPFPQKTSSNPLV